MTVRPALNVFLCAPRGFCAGRVTRAIDVVEHALRKFGAPVMCGMKSSTIAMWSKDCGARAGEFSSRNCRKCRMASIR